MLHFLLVVVGLHLVHTQGQTTTNPIAPSLPFLSEEEEDRLDGIVNRFMLFDTGNLAGPAGARALEDFQKLGYEAIPALLRGLRKSADLAHSCPVIVIAKKLRNLLLKSQDHALLDFARDEVTAIDSTRYRALLTDLRVQLASRMADLDRMKGPSPKPVSPLGRLSVEDLNKRVRLERNEKILSALGRELAQRNDLKAADGLGSLSASVYPAVQLEGLRALSSWVSNRTATQLTALILHESAPVRLQAGIKLIKTQDNQILQALGLLKDPVASVREGIHGELMRQTGSDLPAPGNTQAGQEEAFRLWVGWYKDRPMK